MSNFKVSGEIFNIETLEGHVIPARDIFESRKTQIRANIASIISDPSNSNYIFDPDLHTAVTDTDIPFEHIFKAYVVEPNYNLTEVTLPPFAPQTSSTITIQSNITLQIPLPPSQINYATVVTKTTNSIENTDFNALTVDEKAILEESYREAYIDSIVADTGIEKSVLENADITIILSDDGNGGVSVDFKVTNIPNASEALIEQVQESIVDVNSSGDLSTRVTNKIQTKTDERKNALNDFDGANEIPATSSVSSGISTSNFIPSTQFSDLTEDEKNLLIESYKDAYIQSLSDEIPGLTKQMLENSSIDVTIEDAGTAGILIRTNFNTISGGTETILNNIQDTIVTVNEGGSFKTELDASINQNSQQNGITLTNVNVSNIPSVFTPSVGFATVNSINNRNFSVMTNDEINIFKNAYKQAYIDSLVANSTVPRSVVEGADINIELVDNGSGGISVNVTFVDVPNASQSELSELRNTVETVNSNGALSTNIVSNITTTTSERTQIMIGVDLSGIPPTSAVFIALSRINASGLEVDLSSLGDLANKSLEDMTEAEQFIFKEAYANVYIDNAAAQGIVLQRENLVIVLSSGSVVVTIKVVGIDITNTTFADQVETYFEENKNAMSERELAENISTKAVNIMVEILEDPSNYSGGLVPSTILNQLFIDGNPGPLYNNLKTNFQSEAFIQAVRTSQVENVTLQVTADGTLSNFSIVLFDPNLVGKGIKKLPNKDASMFTDEKKRNAIKQGQLNKSRGGFEKQSIAFQIQRSALRRARSKGYRPHAKRFVKCC